jgi:hypothetical protein
VKPIGFVLRIYPPADGRIGFVSHDSIPNWVRFARFTPRPSHGPGDTLCPHTPVHPSLALFCTIPSVNRLRRGEIGFVWHDWPPASARPPSLNPKSAIRNRGAPSPQIGFVWRKLSPRRHREHGGETGSSPAGRWGLSLGSRCLCGELIISCRRARSGPFQVKADPERRSPVRRPVAGTGVFQSAIRNRQSAIAGLAPPIDVSRAPYVVQKPKQRHVFLYPKISRMSPFPQFAMKCPSRGKKATIQNVPFSLSYAPWALTSLTDPP